MKKFVATIINGDQSFDPARECYRMFPQEPSTIMQLTPVGLPVDGPVISIPDLTFEKAVDKMIEGFERGFMTFMRFAAGSTPPGARCWSEGSELSSDRPPWWGRAEGP